MKNKIFQKLFGGFSLLVFILGLSACSNQTIIASNSRSNSVSQTLNINSKQNLKTINPQTRVS